MIEAAEELLPRAVKRAIAAGKDIFVLSPAGCGLPVVTSNRFTLDKVFFTVRPKHKTPKAPADFVLEG